MIPFREKTPSRRLGRAVCVHYSSYRKTLKEDFDNRCGYCGSFDKIFKRSFTIDHFIPQTPTNFTHTLPPNDYYNLVYSCGYCNSAKTNKWPTKDISKPNDGKKGFIDPVDPAYDSLFFRNTDGSIKLSTPKDALSGYIQRELSLENQVHSVLWKLERIDNSIIKIKNLINNHDRSDLQNSLNSFLASYYDLTQSLYT